MEVRDLQNLAVVQMHVGQNRQVDVFLGGLRINAVPVKARDITRKHR